MRRRGTTLITALVAAVAWGAVAGDAAAYDWYETEGAGEPLRWFRTALSYRISTVEPEEVPWSELEGVSESAFAEWIDLPGCSVPEVSFGGTTTVTTRTRPASLDEPPDNVIVFVRSRQAWSDASYSPTWIAITSIAHNRRTGEIVDADIEVNDGGFEFSTSAPPAAGHVDYVSTLTHELGHFFGLDHSQDPDATMFTTYNKSSNPLGGRTLSQDDIDGVCALYEDVPPHVPPAGGDDGDDCAAADDSRGGSLPAAILSAILGLLLCRPRRRRPHQS